MSQQILQLLHWLRKENPPLQWSQITKRFEWHEKRTTAPNNPLRQKWNKGLRVRFLCHLQSLVPFLILFWLLRQLTDWHENWIHSSTELQTAASISTGCCSVHAVVEVVVTTHDNMQRPTIADDVAFEAPLSSCDVCQQFLVGAGRDTVDASIHE